MRFYLAGGFILTGFMLVFAGLLDAVPANGLWLGIVLVIAGAVLNETRGNENFPSNGRKVSHEKYRGTRLSRLLPWSTEDQEGRYMH